MSAKEIKQVADQVIRKQLKRKGHWGHILIIAFNLDVKPIKCNNQNVTPITPR